MKKKEKKQEIEKVEAPKRRKSGGIFWIIIIAIIAGVFAVFPKLFANKDNTGSSVSAKLITETVKKQDVSQSVKLAGTLSYEEEAAVSLPDTITITEYYVKNGDTVSVGDKVAKVDIESVYYTASIVQKKLDLIDDETVERKKLEKLMVTLNQLINDDHIYAEYAGIIEGVDEELYTEASDTDGEKVTGFAGSGMGSALVMVNRMVIYKTSEDLNTVEADVNNSDSEQTVSGNTNEGSPKEETAGGDTPSENIPSGDTPSGDTPSGDTPSGDTPSENIPSGDTPSGDTPGGDIPAENGYDVYPGIITGINLSSISVAYTKDSKQVSDYKELTGYDFTAVTATSEETIRVSDGYKFYSYSNGKWQEKKLSDLSINDNVLVLAAKDTGITNSTMLVLCKTESGESSETPSGIPSTDPNQSQSGQSGQSGNMPSGNFPSGGSMPSGSQSGMSQSGYSFSSMNVSGIATAGTTVTSTITSIEEVEIYTITPIDYVTFEISIDELDINKFNVGATASVYIYAINSEVDGIVESLSRIGENNGGNTKYTAVVRVDRTDDMISGMNAAADINYNTQEGVYVISVNAISEDEKGSYVFTDYDKEKDELSGKVYIETGVSDGENVEVTSGLSEGDSVYYKYADEITYTFK